MRNDNFEEEARKIIEEESKDVRVLLFDKALGDKFLKNEEL